MKGADIAIGWIDSSGKVTIQVNDTLSLYIFNSIVGPICIW